MSSGFKANIGAKILIIMYFDINLPRSMGCKMFFAVIEASRKWIDNSSVRYGSKNRRTMTIILESSVAVSPMSADLELNRAFGFELNPVVHSDGTLNQLLSGSPSTSFCVRKSRRNEVRP